MTLEFQSEGHTYRLDGREVPSVTQVLEPFSSLEYVDRELLRRAAEFGNHVHEACHLFNIDTLDRRTLDPVLAPYVSAWEQFLDDTGAVVLQSEHRVASRKFKYAGTVDTTVFWGKSKRLIDIKSIASLPRTVGPQTAAYAEAYYEDTGERIRDRYCVQLKPDGAYSVQKLSDPNDWNIFQSALNLYRWYYASH